MTEDERKDRERRNDDLPQPAEDHEDGMIGSVDERSSENRQDGLEEDRERAHETEQQQEDGE